LAVGQGRFDPDDLIVGEVEQQTRERSHTTANTGAMGCAKQAAGRELRVEEAYVACRRGSTDETHDGRGGEGPNHAAEPKSGAAGC
jgi:hypothetical protein